MSDNTTLGHAIFTDLEKNEYLNEIYNSILYNYAIKLLGLADNQAEAINLDDALRFADILSKSYGVPNSEMHHLWAQEIVALLNELYFARFYPVGPGQRCGESDLVPAVLYRGGRQPDLQ